MYIYIYIGGVDCGNVANEQSPHFYNSRVSTLTINLSIMQSPYHYHCLLASVVSCYEINVGYYYSSVGNYKSCKWIISISSLVLSIMHIQAMHLYIYLYIYIYTYIHRVGSSTIQNVTSSLRRILVMAPLAHRVGNKYKIS